MNRFYSVWCLFGAWVSSSLCALIAAYFILRYGHAHAFDYAYAAWNKHRIGLLYDAWQLLHDM